MEKILVAYDFSEASDNALVYACKLSLLFSAKIGIAHIYTIPMPVTEAGYFNIDTLELKENAEKRLNEVRSKLINENAGLKDSEIFVENGPVADKINEIAIKKGYELIIMGIENNPGFVKEHLVGSTSVIESRDFTVPVLIIPDTCRIGKIKSIAFASDYHYDFKGSTTLIQVKYLAAAFNADLKVVHVLEPEHTLNLQEATNDLYIEQKLENTEHKTFFVFQKNAAKGISDFVTQNDIDLVIVEPKHYGFAKNLFHKSVTKELAFHLNLPLLSVHGK